MLMGETGEDLFLNVQCSWFSIHVATLLTIIISNLHFLLVSRGLIT